MEGVVSDDEDSSDEEDSDSDSDDEDRYVHNLSVDDEVIIDAIKPFKPTFDEDTYNALVDLVGECLCMYQWLTKEDGHLMVTNPQSIKDFSNLWKHTKQLHQDLKVWVSRCINSIF